MNARPIIVIVLVSILPALLMAGTCGMNMTGTLPPGNNNNAATSIYGDGSAGARVVAGDENWNNAAQAPTNLQFTDLTIMQGATLTLPSGMTIRCTGTFTNHGHVVVNTGADGGFAGQDAPGDSNDLAATVVDPVAGLGTVAAQAGESGDSSGARQGGRGAFGISEFEARQRVAITTVAGGGGATGGTDNQPGNIVDNKGSSGGGSVRIIAEGGIINSAGATITAEGAGGEGGGGGGGVVILASRTSITNDGSVSTRGGDGEDSDDDEGPGGGGGGGIIHFLAPSISSPGARDVSGGAAGAVSGMVTDADRFGGGGGGASGGSGGNGGGVPAGANPTPNAATAGANGFVLETIVDPSSLL